MLQLKAYCQDDVAPASVDESRRKKTIGKGVWIREIFGQLVYIGEVCKKNKAPVAHSTTDVHLSVLGGG